MITNSSRNRPLRIVHISRNPNTGVASVISALARAQELCGHDVSLMVLKSSSYAPPRLIQELPYQAHWSPDLFGTAAFALHASSGLSHRWTTSLLDTSRPLVAHYHDAWLSGALLLKHRRPGFAQVVTYHGLAAETQLMQQPVRRAIHARWARKVERDAHAVASVDATTPAVAQRLFGVSDQNFHHIPNGSPLFIDFAERRGTNLDIVVGHIGTIDDGKGWRITAQAIDTARERGINAGLLIAGNGNEARLAEDWCRQRSEYCTFLGWVDDIPRDVLSRIDLLAMPSRTEGMPMAALEAISVGVPVVCTRVGGLPEIIRDGQEGCLVERNPESFASAFATLAKDIDLLDRMRTRCRQRWSDQFTDQAMESRYLELYENALFRAA